jgi:hypothetical protein
MLAPVIFYLAGARIRKQISHIVTNVAAPDSSTDDFIRHMQHAMRRSLASEGAIHARTS